MKRRIDKDNLDFCSWINSLFKKTQSIWTKEPNSLFNYILREGYSQAPLVYNDYIIYLMIKEKVCGLSLEGLEKEI